MAVIDELATIISFNVPSSAKAALSGVDKSIGKITSGLKSLGIVSAVTSGLFAAFSVNVAKDATELSNLSTIVGLQTQEIEAMGAVYEKMGGSAKNFAADARKFAENGWGSLDLDRMVSISSEFAGLNDQAANALGRMYDYSEDLVRVLQLGPDEIRKMGEEALKYNTTSEDSISVLKELDRAWSGFKNVITPVSRDIQAAFAPVLEGGLTWLTKTLEENREGIASAMNSIRDGIQTALSAIGEAWDSFNANPVFVQYKQYLADLYESISGLDFKGLFEGMIPGGLSGIKADFSAIGDSVKGFYAEISKAIEGGAIERLFESLKSIASSPVFQVIAGTAWNMIISTFEAMKAAVEPVFQALEGILKVIDGIVNLDVMKALEGFQQIGYAIGDAFEKAFLEVLPKLGEELIKIIESAITKIAVRIGLVSGDTPEAMAQLSNDEGAIRAKANEIYESGKGWFSDEYSREQADVMARDWFNKVHLMPRLQAQNDGGGNAGGISGAGGRGYQGSSMTVNNYYPIDPQTPNSRMYDQSGGQAFAGASNR